jgi:16S rRNA (uracil1498-N3)-methyltransferase
MRRPRFHTAETLSPAARVTLESGPSQHIARTLRMRVGDALTLFSGDGLDYPGEITKIDRGAVTVQLAQPEPVDVESSLAIELGIGMSRGDRMDWVIQKATELGVTRIVPLDTEHSNLRLSADRQAKKQGHWQRIAISACEQCGRSRVPEIGSPMPLPDWISGVDAELRLLLDQRGDRGLLERPGPDSIALLIGPEGGFSEAERTLAADQGFLALALGPRVLRTETAPLAAIAILQSRWGDMR